MELNFDLYKNFSHQIDSFIRFALLKFVETFDLNLAFGVVSRDFSEYYTLSMNLLKTIPVIGFRYLKVLRLKFVNVEGIVIERISTHSLVLAKLSIISSGTLTELRVSGPSIPLKFLQVLGCSSIQRMELHGENVVKLWIRRLSLGFKQSA